MTSPSSPLTAGQLAHAGETIVSMLREASRAIPFYVPAPVAIRMMADIVERDFKKRAEATVPMADHKPVCDAHAFFPMADGKPVCRYCGLIQASPAPAAGGMHWAIFSCGHRENTQSWSPHLFGNLKKGDPIGCGQCGTKQHFEGYEQISQDPDESRSGAAEGAESDTHYATPVGPSYVSPTAAGGELKVDGPLGGCTHPDCGCPIITEYGRGDYIKCKLWPRRASPVQPAEGQTGFNGSFVTAIQALRFLAKYPRPSGGEQRYNSEHLFQIADEIEKSIAAPTLPAEGGE